MRAPRYQSATSDTSDAEPDHRTYKVQKSRLISLVNWYHVVSVFFPYVLMGLVGLFLFQFTYSMYETRDQVEDLARYTMSAKPKVWVLGWQGTFLTLLLVYIFARLEPPVYQLDISVLEPPEDTKVTHPPLQEMMRRQQCFNEESINFMTKIPERSGTGQATAWPPSIVKCLTDGKPQDRSVENARAESKKVVCDCIRDVLEKRAPRREVDILIVNCSLFPRRASAPSRRTSSGCARPRLQPLGHGLQRERHRHRPRQAAAAGGAAPTPSPSS